MKISKTLKISKIFKISKILKITKIFKNFYKKSLNYFLCILNMGRLPYLKIVLRKLNKKEPVSTSTRC